MGCRLALGKCILSLVLWRLLVAAGPEPKLVKATSSWISAEGCPFCKGPPGKEEHRECHDETCHSGHYGGLSSPPPRPTPYFYQMGLISTGEQRGCGKDDSL